MIRASGLSAGDESLYALGDFDGGGRSLVRRLEYAPDHQKTLEMLAPLEFQMGNTLKRSATS